MGSPSKIEWEIGRDAYDRRITLRYDAASATSKGGFTIHRDPISQRDEPEKVGTLTLENLEAIAAAARGMRRG